MSRELRIERHLRHLATSLEANRDQFPVPEAYLSLVVPTVDSFGTSRAPELVVEDEAGGVGNIEVQHGPVPAETVRFYLSAMVEHDDGAMHFLQLGRIIPTGATFPFVGIADARNVPATQSVAESRFYVPPGGFAAARVEAIGAGAQMTLRVLFVDLPVGEYSLLR